MSPKQNAHHHQNDLYRRRTRHHHQNVMSSSSSLSSIIIIIIIIIISPQTQTHKFSAPDSDSSMSLPARGVTYLATIRCPQCGQDTVSVGFYPGPNCLTIGWSHGTRLLCTTRHSPWPPPGRDSAPASPSPPPASPDEVDVDSDWDAEEDFPYFPAVFK